MGGGNGGCALTGQLLLEGGGEAPLCAKCGFSCVLPSPLWSPSCDPPPPPPPPPLPQVSLKLTGQQPLVLGLQVEPSKSSGRQGWTPGSITWDVRTGAVTRIPASGSGSGGASAASLPPVPGGVLEKAVAGMGLDLTSGTLYFTLNGARVGAPVAFPDLVSPCSPGHPSGGAGDGGPSYPRLVPAVEVGGADSRLNLNFGTRPFQCTGPGVDVPVPDNCFMFLRSADAGLPGWYSDPRAKARDIQQRVAQRMATPAGRRLRDVVPGAGVKGAPQPKAVEACRCFARRARAQQLRDSILLHLSVDQIMVGHPVSRRNCPPPPLLSLSPRAAHPLCRLDCSAVCSQTGAPPPP
jgi:hypothetical protein